MQNGNSKTARRFVFHGNAIPIGGRVHRVREDLTPHNLQSPPGSSLSVAGGLCTTTAPGSVFQDIFSWGQCVAQSQGVRKPDGSHVTTVTASIQKISAANGANVFTADQLRLTLVSTHPERGQPSIVPTQVLFGGEKGMFLNKKQITLTTDVDDFRKLSTLESFDSAFQNNKSVFAKYRNRFLTKDGKPPAWKQPIPRMDNGYVACSLVSSIKWGSRKIEGNVLELTGFGKIYFGEILINEYNRRYTLVRLSMGSDIEADVAFAEGDANGSLIP
jgi:hypothetical protein